MLAYTLLVLLCTFHIASGRRNISLDDSDDSIIYHGNWLLTPYDRTNRGGHHMVTADDRAYATLAFNGVAIYFYSPLWPFKVTTEISLDGEKSLIDLRDYDVPLHQDGAETTKSEIVWYADGLSNTSHVLNVSVGAGEDLAVLDYLVYAIVEPGDPPISPTSVSYTHTRSLSLSTSSASPSSSQVAFTKSTSTKIGLSVTLAVVCLIFSSIVLWAFFWWWKRRNRRRLDETSTTSSFDNSNMAETNTHGSSFPRTTGIPRNLSLSIRGKPSRRAGPSSSRRSGGSSSRSAFASMTNAKKTLSTIPESSVDHHDEEVEGDSESQGSSTTTSTSTDTTSPETTSPETSVKNDKPGNPRNDSLQDDQPAVRLVTKS